MDIWQRLFERNTSVGKSDSRSKGLSMIIRIERKYGFVSGQGSQSDLQEIFHIRYIKINALKTFNISLL
jgi:hypothetical protein